MERPSKARQRKMASLTGKKKGSYASGTRGLAKECRQPKIQQKEISSVTPPDVPYVRIVDLDDYDSLLEDHGQIGQMR